MAPVTNMATETASQTTFLAMTKIYDAVDGVGSLCDLDLGRYRSSPNVQKMPDVPCLLLALGIVYLVEAFGFHGRTTITVTIAVYCNAPGFARARIIQAIVVTTIMDAYPVRYIDGLIM